MKTQEIPARIARIARLLVDDEGGPVAGVEPRIGMMLHALAKEARAAVDAAAPTQEPRP